jgi:hypothetical protein
MNSVEFFKLVREDEKLSSVQLKVLIYIAQRGWASLHDVAYAMWPKHKAGRRENWARPVCAALVRKGLIVLHIGRQAEFRLPTESLDITLRYARRQALEDFEAAALAQGHRGSTPPEEWQEIENTYNALKTRVLELLGCDPLPVNSTEPSPLIVPDIFPEEA